MSKMPKQKRGASAQDYCTPDGLIAAIENRFGPIAVDLAASDRSVSVGKVFVSPEQDSLSDAVSWYNLGEKARGEFGCMFCNPPYSNIEPWVRKAASYVPEYDGTRYPLVMLLPASVGANWFIKFAARDSLVLALSPRLTFKGQTQPYPKDCVLLVYNYGVVGFSNWYR